MHKFVKALLMKSMNLIRWDWMGNMCMKMDNS